MADPRWVLGNSLRDLESDINDCERIVANGGRPSYDLLGTLRVNLEVSEGNLNVATSSQAIQFDELQKRARQILKK
jgi:hypothetical protein